MLFACTIENADIEFGVFNGDRLLFEARLATSRERSSDEYAILISSIFQMNRVTPASISGAIIASVVRPLNDIMAQAVEKLMNTKPLLVGPGVKTGLNIKTDIPSQVGADIVANAVAAALISKGPLVIIDFGTATTMTGINAAGELSGVLIGPGVQTSLDALSERAAELPGIALDNPGALLGKNTIESMASGFVYGSAAMVDGLLDRVAKLWNTDSLTIVATGRLAEKIIPYCTGGRTIRYEPHLALRGLRLIHQLNDRRKI